MNYKQYFIFLSTFLTLTTYADCSLENIVLNQNNLQIIYDGYGSAEFKHNKLVLKPKDSKKISETHAALVLLKKQLAKTNYKVQVNYVNVKALREPKPNAWELLWVMFNYQGNVTNKKTNYFIAKTNGIELGKAYGQIDQSFLVTKNQPQIKIAEPIQIDLKLDQNELEIKLNQTTVVKGEYSLFTHKGQIGFYTEDAEVEISQIKYCQW